MVLLREFLTNFLKDIFQYFMCYVLTAFILCYLKYDDRFKRMWIFYLLLCAGGFRVRYSQLWQIVFSKKGIVGGYKSVR